MSRQLMTGADNSRHDEAIHTMTSLGPGAIHKMNRQFMKCSVWFAIHYYTVEDDAQTNLKQCDSR